MLGGLSDDARTEAWAEIEEALRRYQKGDAGFEGLASSTSPWAPGERRALAGVRLTE